MGDGRLPIRALMMASAIGMSALAPSGEAAEPQLTPAGVRTALAKTIPLLQLSGATYIENRECFSCHHQGLPAVAVATAGRRGILVDREIARGQSKFTHAYFKDREKRVRVGEGIPGGAYNAGYALWGLHAEGWPADSVTNDLVQYLRTKHRRDGSWRIRTHRPPLEDSHFTATALSLQGMQLYCGEEGSKDLAERTTRTRAWLLKATAKTNEDCAFRLLGLAWSGADCKDLGKPGKELVARQGDDGGWPQLENLKSDSYATGQALVALKTAGILATTDPAYQRGCRFLLKTQQADGSWLVTSRSKPFQTYFESKFPHGKSQFISICGTCWATLALLKILPVTKTDGSRSGSQP